MSAKSLQVSYSFYQVPEDRQELIKDLVQKNIEGKMDAYFSKVGANKPDAQIRIEYKIQQNKQKRYEAKFVFSYDGKLYTYVNKMAFKYVEDLVNHAFKHFKECLSK